jgi:hypothetical protein
LPLTGIEYRFFGYPPHSLVAIVIEISRLSIVVYRDNECTTLTWLSLWSRILLEKLIVTQLVKKFPYKAYYRVHNSPILKAILCQLNSVQKLKCEPEYLSRYSDGLRAGRSEFDSQQGPETFLYSTASRLALGPNQPPILRVPGVQFPHKAFFPTSDRKSNNGSKTNLMRPNITHQNIII